MDASDIRLGSELWTYDMLAYRPFAGTVCGFGPDRRSAYLAADGRVHECDPRDVYPTRDAAADAARVHAKVMHQCYTKLAAVAFSAAYGVDGPARIDPEAVNFDAPTIDETAMLNGWGGPHKLPEPRVIVTDEDTEDLTHDLGDPVASEAAIAAALDFGRTAEQHLSAGSR